MSAIDSLDTTVLSAYLENHVEGFQGPLTVEKFSGGQSNPTFRVDAASGQYVLRRQPPGKLLKSAHAVDREYRVRAALKDTDVPVASVYHLCEDTNIIGSMFYLMEYCQGTVFWNPAVPEITDNSYRSAMYDEMNRVMAAIHSVDLDATGLSNYGKPGNYFERQYSRWSSQYQASEIQENLGMNQLIEWLGNNMPPDDGRVSLVHGDYRLDNLMFHSEKSEVIAVLDWELSTLGHPFADLAYQCMHLRMPSGVGSLDGLQGVDRVELGIPSEQEYITSYCQRMGLKQIDHFEFYLAFSFFRLAAILQGVAKRATQGNASNKQAATLGKYVDPLAQMALKIIEDGA
jgi:aminoglycoside phosphotransferase (APT) family kinase protein